MFVQRPVCSAVSTVPLRPFHTWQCISRSSAIGCCGESPEWPGRATGARFSACSLLPVARSRKWISLTGLGSVRVRRKQKNNIFRWGCQKHKATHSKTPERSEERLDKPAAKLRCPDVGESVLPCPAETAADMVRAAAEELGETGPGGRGLRLLLPPASRELTAASGAKLRLGLAVEVTREEQRQPGSQVYKPPTRSVCKTSLYRMRMS